MDLKIIHEPENTRFKAIVEGKTSELNYHVLDSENTLDYHHTFVPPELRGQGIAEAIVKYALDYARQNNLKVIPSCSFVKSYIDRHPDYLNLLAQMPP